MGKRAVEVTPEIEAFLRRRYEKYLATKFQTGGRGVMTYRQFKDKMLRERVALFD
jgi:ribosomal protein S17E